MTENDAPLEGTVGGPALISRRTLAKTAAWAIPVIALAAPIPAFAASTDVPVTVSSRCVPGPNGGFAFLSAPIPVGEQLIITLTHSGAGSFSATPNFPHTGSNPFIVDGTGAAFSGEIAVSFSLPPNTTGTVTAVVTGSAGAPVTGDTSSYVTQRRDGNKQNYNQCRAG